MTEEIAMPWDWPVETNQLEAAAFVVGKQSKQAYQFNCLAKRNGWYRDRIFQPINLTGNKPGNINLEYWSSSSPIDQFSQGDFMTSQIGMSGNGPAPRLIFDGFRVHLLYDDFSTPTFDGKHNLIKGGSWISPVIWH